MFHVKQCETTAMGEISRDRRSAVDVGCEREGYGYIKTAVVTGVILPLPILPVKNFFADQQSVYIIIYRLFSLPCAKGAVEQSETEGLPY